MLRVTRSVVVLLLLGCGAAHAQAVRDRVRLHNAGAAEKAVVVDGRRGTLDVNDRSFFALDLGSFYSALFPSIIVDNFTQSSLNNEVIAFAKGRPPALSPGVTWSSAGNTVDATFDDEYAIDVSVWILDSPFEELRELAIQHSVETTRTWRDERQGVRFNRFEIRDVTAKGSSFGLVDCNSVTAIRNQVGWMPDVINVYYVDQVLMDDGPTRFGGWFCGFGYTILMASRTSGDILTHEFGHAFDLGHVDDDRAFFDETNMMHGFSSSRGYLTEGQTFRAVFSPVSALNAVYSVRGGAATRSCAHSTNAGIALCPAVQKRVWADGTWQGD